MVWFWILLEMHKDRPAVRFLLACIYKTDDWPLVIEGNDVEIKLMPYYI